MVHTELLPDWLENKTFKFRYNSCQALSSHLAGPNKIWWMGWHFAKQPSQIHKYCGGFLKVKFQPIWCMNTNYHPNLAMKPSQELFLFFPLMHVPCPTLTNQTLLNQAVKVLTSLFCLRSITTGGLSSRPHILCCLCDIATSKRANTPFHLSISGSSGRFSAERCKDSTNTQNNLPNQSGI